MLYIAYFTIFALSLGSQLYYGAIDWGLTCAAALAVLAAWSEFKHDTACAMMAEMYDEETIKNKVAQYGGK